MDYKKKYFKYKNKYLQYKKKLYGGGSSIEKLDSDAFYHVLKHTLPPGLTARDQIMRGHIFSQVSQKLKQQVDEFNNNKRLVLSAVTNDGRVLEYVSKELQGDEEVVMTAVNQNGLALQYASKNQRKNMNTVIIAVNTDAMALLYAMRPTESLNKTRKNNQAIEHLQDSIVWIENNIWWTVMFYALYINSHNDFKKVPIPLDIFEDSDFKTEFTKKYPEFSMKFFKEKVVDIDGIKKKFMMVDF